MRVPLMTCGSGSNIGKTLFVDAGAGPRAGAHATRRGGVHDRIASPVEAPVYPATIYRLHREAV